MDRGSWLATVHGITKSWARPSTAEYGVTTKCNKHAVTCVWPGKGGQRIKTTHDIRAE